MSHDRRVCQCPICQAARRGDERLKAMSLRVKDDAIKSIKNLAALSGHTISDIARKAIVIGLFQLERRAMARMNAHELFDYLKKETEKEEGNEK